MINTDKTIDWILSILAVLITGVMFLVFPYVWPGLAGETPTTMYFLSTLVFWVPWLIVLFTPLGKSWIPEWARGDDVKKKYIGVFLAVFMGIEVFYFWWGAPYWFIFNYPVALAFAANLGYTWWWPILCIITTAIAIPIVEALKRSGLPRIPRSIW